MNSMHVAPRVRPLDSAFFQGIKLPGFSRNPRVMNSLGQFYVFDFNSLHDGAKVVPCKNFPSYGTKYFSSHGISILNKKGKFPNKA